MTVALHTQRGVHEPLLTPAWHKLDHHPTQERLYYSKHRLIKVTAGRISGKTTLARRRIISYLPVRKPWPDPKYFYALPTYGWAKKVAWDQLVSLVPKHWLAKSPSESDMRIETVFGSKLYVLGLDQPSRVEGAEWDGCVIDESSDTKPGVFSRSIWPALASRAGWCWRIGAPKRFGPGGSEFREAFGQGLLDGSSYTWPSWEIHGPEVIEPLRREMDPKDFAEQIGGNFQDSGGQAYWSFSRARNVRSCGWNRDKQMLVFSDFNVDPMAWCLAHLTDDGKGLEVFDEIWLRDTNTRKTLDFLWNKYGSQHRGGFTFVGDPASTQRHASAADTDYKQILNDKRFTDRRVRYDKAHPAVKDRLAAVNRLLCDASDVTRLWIDPACARLIDDLENRALSPDGEPMKATVGSTAGKLSGHMSDALGYGVWKFFPIVIESLLENNGLIVFG